VFIIIGVLLILIGLIVWKLKVVGIIAGYDSEKVIDKDRLARWVGRNLVLMGTLVILLGVIGTIVPNIKSYFIIPAYLIIVIGLSITTLIGIRRYEKKDKYI
jgi:di/tricarboxylate transporter